MIRKIAKSKDVMSFCNCDFTPNVTKGKDGLYYVRYVKCHLDGGVAGFFEHIAKVNVDGFIGKLKVTQQGLFVYDSGIIY